MNPYFLYNKGKDAKGGYIMFKHEMHSLNRNTIIKIAAILCCIIFGGIFYIINNMPTKEESIIVKAGANIKEYKWTKKIIEKGTTVNATYLWPDETNPAFTGIYRNGKLLSDEKMVTISSGNVYHFRGLSDKSILYTEVYVGTGTKLDIASGKSGTWYKLLPSNIRATFESDGWTWQIGWEYTGRAYLDIDNKRVMIKENDETAVLYGIGLYLDNKYNYSNDASFLQEETNFTNKFGNTENIFASALEYYYMKGGELQSTCPNIYSKIISIISKHDDKPIQSQNDIKPKKKQKTESNTVSENVVTANEPILMNDLLGYTNEQRKQNGLSAITWDKANNDNVKIRAKELTKSLSQTRPDGTDAFSAYTKSVKCEIRIKDMNTSKDIFDNAKDYFLKKNLKSMNCAIYENTGILIFTW